MRRVVFAAVVGMLLVVPGVASAGTTHCRGLNGNEVGYSDLSISISTASMNAIYRENPKIWESRRAATCELADLVAIPASHGEFDTSSFNVHGAGWNVGRYHCTFSKTIPAGTPATPDEAEEIAGNEWDVCSHTGRYANQVRFISTLEIE
jgi:hypothetical protein